MALTKIADSLITKNTWSTPTTMTFTTLGTGTFIKGAGTVIDKIQYMMMPGTKLAMVRFEYSHTLPGANATGIILINMPGGLVADSTIAPIHSTLALSSQYHTGMSYRLLGSTGISSNGDANGGHGSVVLYDVNRFAVHYEFGATSFGVWSSATHGLATANTRCAGWFIVPVL